MRTKALLVAAALAAGLASSMAQNVYSLNVVGYYNVTIPAGKLQVIANQFDAANNNLSQVIPATSVPDGTQVYKWTGAGFGVIALAEEGEWDKDFAMPPGDAFFVRNNTASDMTITLVGEVPQGEALTTQVPAGFSMKASIVPQAGDLSTMGFPAAEGDQVYFWNPATGSYNPICLFEEGEWDKPPVVTVGGGFFSRKNADVSWTRNFTVPQN